MAHHSEEQLPDNEELNELLPDDDSDQTLDKDLPEHLQKRLDEAAEEQDLGATGEHPEGKLAEHDEGELRYGVTDAEGKVIINFGKPVRSMGMTPEQAKRLGGTLINRARQAKKEKV